MTPTTSTDLDSLAEVDEFQVAFMRRLSSQFRLVLGMLSMVRDNLPRDTPIAFDVENIVIHLRTLHDYASAEFPRLPIHPDPHERADEANEPSQSAQPKLFH
ncbi:MULTISPECIES: hypothetical protein [Burkholderia]|uniref:hypothetical protein n=1 Tax=Burkholderia TaxID=32008 RepID=UPI00048040B2|nr:MULTISPECIES: hypothetical protein [Burkholderia]